MVVNRQLFIFGIGQQAQVATYYFEKVLARTVHGYIIEAHDGPSTLNQRPIFKLASIRDDLIGSNKEVFVAIGGIALNAIREHYYLLLSKLGVSIASLICPQENLNIDFSKSINTFIDPTSAIGPYSLIGNNLIVYGSTISHHSVIEDHVSLNAAMIGANCRIGRNSIIALSATIESGVTIGEFCMIDSGAVVKQDVPPYSIVTAPRAHRRRIDCRRVKILGESWRGFMSKIKPHY
jgi:acetyltransferase-like isoleucine patch superfamily enzyme